MELPKLEDIELQYFDQWLSNLVDSVNYDLQQIEIAVIALDKILVNIDAAPFQSLQESLNQMIKGINESFEQITEQFARYERRLKALGG